jgi:hypothetical protein
MTKVNRRWIPIFILVLLTPLAARAAAVDPQSIELNGFFTFDHTSASIETPGGDFDIGRTIFDLEPGIGYFFNSNWELLGSLIINHESNGDLGDSDHFGIKADGLYHFNTTGSVIPFAGVGLGMLTNGGDNNGDNTSIIVPELLVGVRWPFKNIVSFNFTGGYRHITNFRGSDEGGDSFFLGVGFSVFLQGGAQ